MESCILTLVFVWHTLGLMEDIACLFFDSEFDRQQFQADLPHLGFAVGQLTDLFISNLGVGGWDIGDRDPVSFVGELEREQVDDYY